MTSTIATIELFIILALLAGAAWKQTRRPEPRPLSEQPISSATPTPTSAPTSRSSSASTSAGVAALHGEPSLQEAYRELRERADLVKVQAIWSADYGDIDTDAYFKEESSWLAHHPHVEVERVVVGQPGRIDYLRELTAKHGNLSVFTSHTGIEFELYLCEYRPREMQGHMAGILVVNSALSQRPEFGVRLDGGLDPALTQFGYSLRQWFDSIPKTVVTGAEQDQDVWTRNASEYDQFVSRTSKLPFLRDYIKQEDDLIESLVKEASRQVTIVEFGSGTGRTLEHLRSTPVADGKVDFFIGIDHSPGMIETSQRKRDRDRSETSRRTYYFSLDGARAQRAFWNGHIRVDESMNDGAHLARADLDPGRYANTDKIICCLLNTLGVLDTATREAMMSNMVNAAGTNDLIVVSAFAEEAFTHHARVLYPFIRRLVGQPEISEQSYSDDLSEFRAGYYYSHWFGEGELAGIVEHAGGEIIDRQPISSGGDVIGRVLIARNPVT
jgi:hypothetical protein